ncbi:acyl carrier protein [Streptomyces sp. NPDC020607]|uniref:acyl carrier protein n=1 Tax=Streptomyces sp. NPDC020607 TaxID=3365082 RepID=UPI0037A63C8A
MMSRNLLPTRLAATAALLLVAGALSIPTATAESRSPAPGDAYVLTVSTDPAKTAYDDRKVDVTGTVTKADGTPAPGIPVTLREVVRFTTWNPWGDPIDPNYYEPRDLGTPVSDANGKFTLPDVEIDHVSGSSLLNVEQDVQITAQYDEDGDPDTPQDGYFADTTVYADAKPSSLSYKVNKTKVKAGDILTVQGRVDLPKGVDPGGTEIFLQTYWESQYHVKTTAEDDGFFVLSVRVSRDDDAFRLRTAPRDLYVQGKEQNLPITNTSLPRP